jgi:hypothetical protein
VDLVEVFSEADFAALWERFAALWERFAALWERFATPRATSLPV